jgi:hypothetical protein
MNTQEKIVEIIEGITTLLLEKNKRYGDSALTPTNIFSKLPAGEAIKVRLDDKISRIINSSELRTNDVSDIIGYCVLYLISQDVSKKDILELID